MIKIDRLTISNTVGTILDDISLKIGQGERAALIGPSGSGKSTLSFALLGEIAAGLNLTGNIEVMGELMVHDGKQAKPKILRSVRNRVGRLDQSPAASLNPSHKISRLVSELAVGSKVEVAERMRQSLKLFGLPTDKEFLSRYCGEISGGQQRRVALARTLMRQPELVILDEPTAGLDPQSTDSVLDLVQTLVDSLDATLLVITHDIRVAHTLATSFYRIVDAKIIPTEVTKPEPTRAFSQLPQKESNPILQVSELVAAAPSLETPPVLGLSFSVHAGEAVAITGPSGCGKSTVARTLVGLWQRRGGSVELCGQQLPDRLGKWPGQLRGTIGWVPQDPVTTVNPVLTLGKSMRRASLRKNGSVQNSIATVNEICELVGLPVDWAKRYPKQLSGGQLQRFSIARALVSGAKLLVFDEVTSNLDLVTRDEICELLVQLKREVPMIVITHDPEVVLQVCDREISLAPTG